jgi:MscS family membrane protein
MRRHRTPASLLALLVLGVALGGALGWASGVPGARAAAAPAPAPAAGDTPCDTPREAVSTLVSWLDPARRSPARAAGCFDRTGLEDPERTAPLLAEQLKKVLDVRGLEVVPEELPDDPAYVDEAGRHRFLLFPATLDGAVALERKGDRWLFTAETLARVPALYHAAFPIGLSDLIEELPSWLRASFLGFEAWQLLGILVLAFLALVLQKVVVWALSSWLQRLVGRLPVKWVSTAVSRSSKPIGGLAMALVFVAGLPVLQLGVRANRLGLVAIRVLAAFSLVWLAYRLVDVLSDWLAAKAAKTDTKLDDQLVPLLRKSLKLFAAVVGGIFLLQNLHVDVGSLLAGLGLGGLAFALAAKDTVANFFGSLMIFIDKPFQVGDWIKMSGDVEGTVEEVGFRTTRIRTFYNSLITLPNAKVTETAVDNLGARAYRRYKTTLGLQYDTPPEKVQAFCAGVRGIIQALPGMRTDFYLVEFVDYGPHSLDVLLYCFMVAPTWGDELRTRTHLNLEILRLAKELDVRFAFPTRTLHVFPSPGPEEPTASAEPAALADVVRAFGPRGRLHRPSGVELGVSYDAGALERGEEQTN